MEKKIDEIENSAKEVDNAKIVDELRVFQIITGSTDSEFYSFSTPIFSENFEKINCTEVILKMFVSKEILNSPISVSYSSAIGDLSFELSEGVGIKTILYDKVSDWFDRTKDDAETLLKDKELEVYRDTLPKLIKKLELQTGNVSQNRPPSTYML